MSSFGTSTSPLSVCAWWCRTGCYAKPWHAFFQKKPGIIVVGKECSVTKLPESAGEPIDVLLMDSLKAACAKDLKETPPSHQQLPKAIFFGMDDDPECFLRAIRNGARGYLLKDASAEEIVSAVRRVAEGEAVCPPKLCRLLFERVAREESLFANAPKRPVK
jgi:DNA-binding NarL/FixJ family response regulator